MKFAILQASTLLLSIVSAAPSACPSLQQAIVSSASDWPKPTGDLSSYISSFSSAHNGMFTNCEVFTSGMPSSLSGPYQSWVTSVSEWSTSFVASVSAEASTCNALNANVVIATPLCPNGNVAGANSSPTSAASTSGSASSSSTATASSASGSSGASLLVHSHDTLLWVILAGMGTVGVFAVAL